MAALRLITHRNTTLPTDTDAQSLEAMLSVEVSDFWEPVFNNFGHTLRKLGKISEAISVHRFLLFRFFMEILLEKIAIF
jgi:hypothetical protein